MPEFTEPQNWPSNSPYLNPADYSVWTALQQMVYRHKISDTGQLQKVLIDSLAQVSQDTLNQASDQLLKRMRMVVKEKTLVLAKLCDLKNSPVFWPTLYIYFLLTSFSLPFSELSLVGLALDLTNHRPSASVL